MKNVVYFILKAFLAFEIFLSWIFGHAEEWLDKKVKVNSKIMTSQ